MEPRVSQTTYNAHGIGDAILAFFIGLSCTIVSITPVIYVGIYLWKKSEFPPIPQWGYLAYAAWFFVFTMPIYISMLPFYANPWYKFLSTKK